MPAWLLPAALGAMGFLGGSQKNKQTSTTTNTLDPAYSPLQSALLQQTLSRLNSPTALPPGFESQGIGKINDTFRTVQQGIGNRAAQSGMTGSPGEMYALGNTDMARGGQIADFSTGLPLLERDMRNQDMAFAGNVLGQGRYNSTTTGTSGGGLGGGLAGLGGMLGFMYGQSGTSGGMFDKLLAQYMGNGDPGVGG